jgi:MFS family permease
MPTLRRTFRSLHTRNYRLFYAGQLVSVSGSWCQSVALSWLVFVVTRSGVALGVVTALQFLPMVAFGPWGGLLADRFDKRHLLIAANAFLGVTAAVLAGLTLGGVVQVWHLYLFSLLQGIGTAFEIPSRQSFVTELVGPDDLANAIGLNSALFNGSRVIGPAIAGVLIQVVGNGWCFAVNAVSFLVVIEAYRRMRASELHQPPPTARAKGQMREGVSVAWRTPVLRRTILGVGLFSFLGFNFQVLLPILTDRSYHGGSGLFSAVTAAMAFGSVVGALLVASRRLPSDRLLLASGASFGVVCLLASLSTDLRIALPLLVLSGGLGICFLSTANARTQLAATPALRGRVMSLYALVLLGATPAAAPVVGWIAEHVGARAVLAGGGVATAVVMAAVFGPVALRGGDAPDHSQTDLEAVTSQAATAELAADAALSPA